MPIGLTLDVGPKGDDCLNLNVWTPELGDARLPVLVWIHGGALMFGSGSEAGYDGATFARDGVLTVTINYRLASAGFMHVGERAGTGAFGLLDQIAALRWVQENITAFGGDPDKITIAGQSAGSNSVAALLAAPAARGLFRRAILQSGIAPCQVRAETAAVIGAEILQRLGVRREEDFENIGTAELFAAQRAVDSETLPLLASKGVTPDFVTTVFAHTLHLVHGTDTLPAPTIPAIAGGSARDIDLLFGTNADEYGFFVSLLPSMGDQATAARSALAALALGEGGAPAVELYRQNRPQAAELDVTNAFMTDMLFRVPMIGVAEAALKHNTNVYMYRYDYGPPSAPATHCSELPFMWDTLENRSFWDGVVRLDNPPQALADTMHGAWASFIKGGIPTNSGLPDWPRYDTQRRATMIFDTATQLIGDPAGDERRAWPSADYMW
ncbi:carboxylesterase/lipase family protein [Aminobacter anthyllidis]|uniref:Carboxylic ester hydrolase n=1 Tax=Aminobacter anthyllidis TaxID=1035067 RepID=A0A9X1A941_9HYPH|nr:carboxylesterase/lipase family protein [Aminobacter anthyllidis]